MYAKYQYVSGATQANILADLTAILTGETDKANLSAGCDQTNTTITSTIAAGWTLHDGSSGTNKKVIKAPYSGNGAVYKYVELSIDTTALFTAFLYETFNESTHTGTNITSNGTTTRQQLTLGTTSNKIHLFSSARMIVLLSETTVYGDSTHNGALVIAEMKPLCPWNNDTSYPYPSVCLILPVVWSGTTTAYNCYLSRVKNRLNTDLTGASATSTVGSIGGLGSNINSASYFPTGSDAKVYDESGNLKVPRFPLFPVYPAVFTMPLGDISVCNVSSM